MNREIKFRYWNDSRKFMYNNVGYHPHEAKDLSMDPESNDHYKPEDEGSYLVAPFLGGVLMQYIGLKDKNGKEIYEGDIVDCDMVYKGGAIPHRGEIVYNGAFGAFATKNEAGETLLHNHYLSSLKIIGNIYENPELTQPLTK